MCDPIQLEFASVEGEESAKDGKPCGVCWRPAWSRHGTISAYWSRGRGVPTKFGSFTWGADRPLVVRSLAAVLASRFAAVKTRRVKFPGKRPRLEGDSSIVDLDSRITLDALPSSTIKMGERCGSCGLVRQDLLGVEDTGRRRRNGKIVRTVIPRRRGHGLFVDASRAEAAGYFLWEDRPFCTTDFKTVVEDFGATNVHFAEWGETERRRK